MENGYDTRGLEGVVFGFHLPLLLPGSAPRIGLDLSQSNRPSLSTPRMSVSNLSDNTPGFMRLSSDNKASESFRPAHTGKGKEKGEAPHMQKSMNRGLYFKLHIRNKM